MKPEMPAQAGAVLGFLWAIYVAGAMIMGFTLWQCPTQPSLGAVAKAVVWPIVLEVMALTKSDEFCAAGDVKPS